MSLAKHYYDLYLNLNKQKIFDLAERVLRKAIEIDEQSLYYYELSKLLKRQSKWWQVVESLEQSFRLNPENNHEYKLAYIDALEKMHHFKDALVLYGTLDSKEMQSHNYFRYGVALKKEGMLKEAKKVFLKAIKIDEEYQSDILGIGIFYEKKGNWLASLSCYEEKAKNEPFNALLHYKLGLSYDRNYRWEEAKKSLAYAITLENSKGYFFNRLAFAYERDKQYLEASEMYALAIHKEKTNKPYWSYRLGYCLFKLNKFKDSCEAFLNITTEEKKPELIYYNEIEEKIREPHKETLLSHFKQLFNQINHLTFQENLNEIIKIAKKVQLWEVVEEAYQELLLRDETFGVKEYLGLGFALYQQGKYLEASQCLIDQRVIQDAHGTSEKKFNSNKIFNRITTYTEYLKRERILEESILYEVDGNFKKDDKVYQLFLQLIKDNTFKSWRHIWVIPTNMELLEEYRNFSNIIFISKSRNLYLKYLASSKYLLSNSTFPSYFIRKKEQKYLSFLENIKEETSQEFELERHNLLHATHVIVSHKKDYDLMLSAYNIKDILTAKIFIEKESIEQSCLEFFFLDKQGSSSLINNTIDKETLLFFAPFEPNGIGASIFNLLQNIDLNKYSVTVVMGFDDKTNKLKDLDPRINIIIRIGRMLLTIEEQWVRDKFTLYTNLDSEEMLSIYKASFTREFIRIFGRHQFDTIIDFNGYRTFWTSLLAFGNSKQKLIYLHSDMHKEHKLRFPSLAITFNLYKYFDKLISVSKTTMQSNMDALSTRYSLSKDKFSFVNNPLDIEGYELLSDETLDTVAYRKFMDEPRKKFINVARLSPEKGQLKLIEVFIQLLKNHQNIVLYILGAGPLYTKIAHKIKETQMQEHIILLGHQSNPYPFINNADCMLLTSEHEGQSLVLLESLVLERPCISTDIPGPRSILEDGYGVLCGEGISDIVKSLELFLNNSYIFKSFDSLAYNQKSLKMFYTILSET